jgi:hypothetical protein
LDDRVGCKAMLVTALIANTSVWLAAETHRDELES